MMRRREFLPGLFLPALLMAQGHAPSDDHIYDEVRMKLAQDRDIGGNAYEVEVKDGEVTLSGKVQSQKQKTRAEHVARKVKGVKSVNNKLVIETTR
jgi:osmotically-inducible protein OsmY